MRIVRIVLFLPAVLAVCPVPQARADSDFTVALRTEIRRLEAPPQAVDDVLAPATTHDRPTPRNAFFLSALLPGLGQLYASGWDVISYSGVRAAGYAAFEGFGWVQYADYKRRGWDEQDIYRAYADENWHWKEDPCSYPNEYRDALPEPPVLDTEAQRLEFYEDIHKLPKWICGWDDYPDEVYLREDEGVVIEETPMRVEYRAMRRKQNDLLTTSRHWLLAIIANHGVSAFDAYFTSRRLARGDAEVPDGLSIDFGSPVTGVGGTVGLAYNF